MVSDEQGDLDGWKVEVQTEKGAHSAGADVKFIMTTVIMMLATQLLSNQLYI